MKNTKKITIESTQHLRTLIDNFPFMVWLKDTESRLLAANTSYANMVGAPSAESLIGKTDFDFFPPDLAKQYVDGDKEAMSSKTPIGVVVPITNSEGASYWIESYKSALVENGKIVGSLGYARDITKNIQKEQEYQSLVENSPNSIVRFNKDCQRVFLNHKCAQQFELKSSFLKGKSPSQVPGGELGIAYESKIREVLQHGENRNIDLKWITNDGRQKVIHILLAPEFNAQHQVEAVIAVEQDVTESYENQDRIQNLAYFDSLTKLPNRTSFLEKLDNAIRKSNQQKLSFALLILDLDEFKAVNDLLGHANGDLLLCEAARRIEQCLRSSDIVARLGGDEFAIIASDIHDYEKAALIANKVLHAFEQPILISNKELFITVSIGLAISLSNNGHASNLVNFADTAMYQAKKQGKNNFQFYSAEMTQSTIERIDIVTALRKAIPNKEFEIHYQPQINIQTGTLIGVEALLRWNRNHNEMIPPDKFIGIAEDSGIIIDIGKWVILNGFNDAVRWNKNRNKPISVAINLSSRQFIHNDLVSSIKEALTMSGCNPSWITLEITESLLLNDKEETKAILVQLEKMGFTISLDDFGTGYSALSYLNKFPVDEIKIDKSFVQSIVDNPAHASIVQAIISMAKSLGKEVVAEGVETSDQAKAILQMGCQVVQGYFYGRPVPFNDIVISEYHAPSLD